MQTSGFIQDNSDIEDKKLDYAKKLYLSGNFSGALKLYLDMVNTSYSYKLYYEIGRCYYKLGEMEKAESFFKQSISLELRKNPSYAFLGNIYHKRQEVEKAIEYWIKAYSYRPDDETVCLNLASSYFSKDMKFQSMLFYEKYLKFAKDKAASYYKEIKHSVEEFVRMGNDFYQKAMRAVGMKDNKTAIQSLEYAARNYPTNFDINYKLGKLCYEEKEYMKALVYLKQAYCLDKRSLDVLEILSSVMINLGDFTGAYCCLKRIMPLVINNQKEYYEIIQTIKQLEDSFDHLSYQGHLEWAQNYYNENNYHFALFEYENCVIIDNLSMAKYEEIMDNLKRFLNPEERIVKFCFEKGGALYSLGDYKQSNKYFSKIMLLSEEDSSEYRFARSKIVNV